MGTADIPAASHVTDVARQQILYVYKEFYWTEVTDHLPINVLLFPAFWLRKTLLSGQWCSHKEN